MVKRDIRFARQLRLASKVKVPFPHCLSVVLRELQSNSLQMLTQGTADIVLDCCDDFWDGRDLRPLGPSERKRAQVSANSQFNVITKSNFDFSSSGFLSTERFDRILHGIRVSTTSPWYFRCIGRDSVLGIAARYKLSNDWSPRT